MPDWQEIVRSDGPAVWRTAYRILGNTADADECFQDAFLDALELSTRDNIRHWRGMLQRLVAARSIDRLRRNIRRRDRDAFDDWETVHDSRPSPPQAAEDAELAAHFREALARIPPRQAEAFCLYSLDGWSYQEIAGQLSMSIDAVGVLLHRARKRLRKLLPTPSQSDVSRIEQSDAASNRAAANPPKKESS
jgi:RNA polymerase sigma-70 factor (ECF subfamily)